MHYKFGTIIVVVAIWLYIIKFIGMVAYIGMTPIWQCKPSVPVDVIGNPSTPQSFSMFNHWSGDLVCEIRFAYCQHQLPTLDITPDCHVAVNLCSVANANPTDGG